jgi:hypothetical protein
MKTKREAYRKRLQETHAELDAFSRSLLKTADVTLVADVEAIAACGVLLRYLEFRLLQFVPREEER